MEKYMEYAFDIEEAKQFGVEEAIMLKNFKFWIQKNQANEKHFYDNRTWTFNSIRAFCTLFPFWSEGQIKRILKSLIDQKVLTTGNYNKTKYDKTNWYAFIDLEFTIGRNQPMDKMKSSNQLDGNSQPIPDVNTDNKLQIINKDIKDNNKDLETTIYKKIIDGFYQYHNKQYKFDNKEYGIAKRLSKTLSQYDNWEEILQQKVNGLEQKVKENSKFWSFTIPKLEYGWNEFIDKKSESEEQTRRIFEQLKAKGVIK
jgi:hypothetical protein